MKVYQILEGLRDNIASVSSANEKSSLCVLYGFGSSSFQRPLHALVLRFTDESNVQRGERGEMQGGGGKKE